VVAMWSPSCRHADRRTRFDPRHPDARIEEVEHRELIHPPRPRLPSLRLPQRGQATGVALLTSDARHGTWTFAVDLPSLTGKRTTMRHGHYFSPKAATAALTHVLEYERVGIWLDDRQTSPTTSPPAWPRSPARSNRPPLPPPPTTSAKIWFPRSAPSVWRSSTPPCRPLHRQATRRRPWSNDDSPHRRDLVQRTCRRRPPAPPATQPGPPRAAAAPTRAEPALLDACRRRNLPAPLRRRRPARRPVRATGRHWTPQGRGPRPR
jgi:hypothetical protein